MFTSLSVIDRLSLLYSRRDWVIDSPERLERTTTQDLRGCAARETETGGVNTVCDREREAADPVPLQNYALRAVLTDPAITLGELAPIPDLPEWRPAAHILQRLQNSGIAWNQLLAENCCARDLVASPLREYEGAGGTN